ncbi:MAG: nuclear transport factor 2 family protein [Bacteroidota bacterium]
MINKMLKQLFTVLFIIFTSTVFSQKLIGNQDDLDQILKNIDQFSGYVMAGDYRKIGEAYTEDAKIFPERQDIIEGRDAIIKYWTRPAGIKTSYHKIIPSEIKVVNNEAYDYGYYEGKTKRANGSESFWKGKYVIVWKRVNQEWKIYLDIWSALK